MQLVVNGLVVGAILSIGAVGLTLVSRILHFFYFGYAGMLVLGAYFTLTFFNYFGVPLVLSLLISILLMAILAISIDGLTFKRLRSRGTGAFGMMVVGIGLDLMLRSSVRMIWGSGVKMYDIPITRAMVYHLT